MRGRYIRWSDERLRILNELFAAGYDCAGAAARLSVILGRAVSEDSVRRAAVRAGLEPAAGRRAAPEPFGVLRGSPGLPSYFRAPPPQVAIGIQALERERIQREADEAKRHRPSRVIILDGGDSDPAEVQGLVDGVWTQLWADFCKGEAGAGRVPEDQAREAAAAPIPPWFRSWGSVLVVEVVEVDGAAEGRLVSTAPDIGTNYSEGDEEVDPW